MIHSKIKGAGELAKTAFNKLKKIQTGEDKLLKTGRPYIDNHIGGLLPSDCVTIFAPSGVGKTIEFFKIFKNILDTKVNPNAGKYCTLEFNLEMLYFNLMLRDANKLLKKSKTSILQNEFTEQEKETIKKYFEAQKDGRRFIVEEGITTQEFFEICDSFCEQNKDKEGIVIGIDHILLIKPSERGEDALEKTTAHINELRKKFKNVYFILLSQMNRSIYSLNVKEKSNALIPTTSMIYGASHFEFLSSYIFAITNPYKTFGINEYMKVRKERYEKFSEFMTDEDSKGFVSFNTIGNLFYHALKLRDTDDQFDTLHIEKMDLTQEQLDRMKSDSLKNTETVEIEVPFTPMPVFDMTDSFNIK